MTLHALVPEHPFVARLRRAPCGAAAVGRRAGLNAAALAATDLAALSAALLLGGVLRAWAFRETGLALGPAWGVVPLYLGGAALSGLLPGYGLGIVEELRRVCLLLVGVFALAVVGLWLAGPNAGTASRLTLGSAGLLSLAFVPYARTRTKGWLVRRDLWGVPAVVYGAGPAGALVVRQLQEERGMGYIPTAVFADEPERWGDHLDTVPVLGPTDRVVRDGAVAFLAMPEAPRAQQITLLEGTLSHYGTVVVVPDLFEAPSLWVKPRDLVGVLGLEVTSNLARPLARILKRVLDLGVAVLTLPLWLPLVGLLAGLVWVEDRHPPFFRQERVGAGGRLFRAWKLRTMVPDADAALEDALSADPALRTEWDVHHKLERDPRITRVGAVLRRSSLDELPQLVNVLRGEMSLVGPRPLPRDHHRELEPRVAALREVVRPGITGMWQVSGRSDTGTQGMERWDPYYVRNWSLWLDLVILVRTLRVVFRRAGAY